MPVLVEELADAPAFAALSHAELERLAARGERMVVPAGAELAKEGDFGHSFFVIVEGTAQVAVAGAILRKLAPGDVFGEVAVLTSGRRTASVTATTPMTLISLFKRDAWELETQNPAFGVQLRALVADRA